MRHSHRRHSHCTARISARLDTARRLLGGLVGLLALAAFAAAPAAALPDLTVTSVTFDADCNATFQITNLGVDVAAGATQFTARPLSVPAWGPGPQVGWGAAIFNLGAGQSSFQTWPNVRVFGGLITVSVDPQDQIAESDEGNNVGQFPVPATCQERNKVCVDPPADLVAWYTLDNSTVDSALANDAVIGVGTSPVYVAGVVAAGMSFDGIDDYLEAPDDPSLDFGTGDLTIDAWVKADPSQTGIRSIVEKRIQATTTQGYTLFLQNGVLQFQLADGVGSSFCSTASTSSCTNYSSGVHVADGEWHFLAVTIDRDEPDGGRWYVDGIEVGKRFNPTFRSGSLDNAAPLRIARHAVWTNNYFGGKLDEIELFRRELTPQEIQDLYEAGPAGKCKFRIHRPWDLRYCRDQEELLFEVTVCNDGPEPRSFDISEIDGLPAGSLGGTCTVDGPTDFTVLATGVVVLPGECASIPVLVRWPAGQSASNELGCFSVTLDDGTGVCRQTEGAVFSVNDWCASTPEGPVVGVPVKASAEVSFTVSNTGKEPRTLSFDLTAAASDMVSANTVVSLDGLPPGEPVTGELLLSPNDPAEIRVSVTFEEEGADFYDLILTAVEEEGPEPLISVGLQSVPAP